MSGVAPVRDLESTVWWEGLAHGELRLQQCTSCDRTRFPRLPACPYCGSPGQREVLGSGKGTVYSWIRVHRPLGPAAPETPYVIATVDLDEGCRIFARVEHDGDRVAVDMRVRACFVGRDGWTELCVREDLT